MIICSGVYLMGVGRSLTGQAPVETVKIKLTSGAQYEMLDPYGWHWVQPLGAPVMSVMLTWEPWQMPENFPKHGKGVEHEDLAPEVRDEILQWFRADMGIVPGGHG